MSAGYIICFYNPVFPKFLTITSSSKNPEEKLRKYNSGKRALPTEYIIVFSQYDLDYKKTIDTIYKNLINFKSKNGYKCYKCNLTHVINFYTNNKKNLEIKNVNDIKDNIKDKTRFYHRYFDNEWYGYWDINTKSITCNGKSYGGLSPFNKFVTDNIKSTNNLNRVKPTTNALTDCKIEVDNMFISINQYKLILKNK